MSQRTVWLPGQGQAPRRSIATVACSSLYVPTLTMSLVAPNRTSAPKRIRLRTSAGAIDGSRRGPSGPLLNILAAQGAHSRGASGEF